MPLTKVAARCFTDGVSLNQWIAAAEQTLLSRVNPNEPNLSFLSYVSELGERLINPGLTVVTTLLQTNGGGEEGVICLDQRPVSSGR